MRYTAGGSVQVASKNRILNGIDPVQVWLKFCFQEKEERFCLVGEFLGVVNASPHKHFYAEVAVRKAGKVSKQLRNSLLASYLEVSRRLLYINDVL